MLSEQFGECPLPDALGACNETQQSMQSCRLRLTSMGLVLQAQLWIVAHECLAEWTQKQHSVLGMSFHMSTQQDLLEF